MRRLQAQLDDARAALDNVNGQVYLAYQRGWAACERHHGLDQPDSQATVGRHRRTGRHLVALPSSIAGVAPVAAAATIVASHGRAAVATAAVAAVAAAAGSGLYLTPAVITPPTAARHTHTPGGLGGWTGPGATRISIPGTRPLPLAGAGADAATATPAPVVSSPAAAPVPAAPPVAASVPAPSPSGAPSLVAPTTLPLAVPSSVIPSPVPTRSRGRHRRDSGGPSGRPGGRHHRDHETPTPGPAGTVPGWGPSLSPAG
ncbi:MAG TPA: hypothetical protein VH092_31215 [Urbifossiella sp.]|nr:hypothetical protein [Urbifossiella sp.]